MLSCKLTGGEGIIKKLIGGKKMTPQLPYMSQSGIEYNLSRIRSPDSVKMKKNLDILVSHMCFLNVNINVKKFLIFQTEKKKPIGNVYLVNRRQLNTLIATFIGVVGLPSQ